MTTKILTADESKKWQNKLDNNISASPLVFARADEANSPFMIEVTNGQDENGKNLIIHVFKRGDLDPEKALLIFKHALQDTFGRQGAIEGECFYINAAEMNKKMGGKTFAHDSMDVTFHSGTTTACIRSKEWVRDRLAAGLRKWYERSFSW